MAGDQMPAINVVLA